MSATDYTNHFILYSTPQGVWRTKRISRMGQANIDAYAQYRPALLHNGKKPR